MDPKVYEAYRVINEKLTRIHGEALSLQTYLDFTDMMEKEVLRWILKHVEGVIDVLFTFKKSIKQRVERQARIGDYLG